ncbi:hypothetical protein LMQOC1_40149 [Listeria monocytogenes QOC1]|nr:hypothetical protein LMQOC2_30149 [Listeria monocytogenes QOC2]CDK41709.1 hypothetical protein LMQOC1_40149 [Listeria monocytogenes QOC1]
MTRGANGSRIINIGHQSPTKKGIMIIRVRGENPARFNY